ncbi:uncharacterized protein LOC126688118 isoform X2 [Mercurialis annua]|uniref:uncharacterized protein LOC126688118 isoform X2 n=1 Tax=Mercurialis annua TaxID=3986 RepID=UPI00215F1B23|nr:uncharacterized protein LOC126688118 isoform X2 [Mercurialis annua]
MEDTQDEKAEESLSPCSSEMEDTFRDPEVLPRIGHEFQAEIPHLISLHDRLQLITTPKLTEFTDNIHELSPLGLPVPITWSETGVENINGIVEIQDSEESQITYNNEHLELNGGVHSNILENGSYKMDSDIVLPQQSESKMNIVKRSLRALPDSLGGSWTNAERDSFLLGLYIFGKNLIAVKKFVETKNMGDILSFYYGMFYRSAEYCRWSDCLEQRSRRSIHGQKIFTGWRQQELMSRLSSQVSPECQSLLLEAFRTFAEGRISFEEYVFALRNTVGINMLTQAVSIGKGKDDLTGTAMEPVKAANHTILTRPEIPVGKAWSSLTSADIVKFLTGDIRLSKARSNDLFWEAVWPRLLARGWHSEQPRDNGTSCYKNSLVFLIPGVKKFSRRRLVKGNHYFDSVSDVLSKVASEPGLLKLDVETLISTQHKEEGGEDPLLKADQDGLLKKQHHCYLQPRNLDYNRKLPKFTVVDTSLAYGAERPKVRELRSLPAETASLSTFSSLSSETDEDSSDDSQENIAETNTSNRKEDVTERRDCADSLDLENRPLSTAVHNLSDPFSAEGSHEINKDIKKVAKHRVIRKPKSSCSKYMVPIAKPLGKIACDRGESSCSIKLESADRKLTQYESHYMSNSSDACGGMVFQVCQNQHLSSASSLVKDSPAGSYEGAVNEPQFPKLFDLNMPSDSPDFAVDEHSMTTTGMEQNNEYSSVNNSSFLSRSDEQHESCKFPDAEVCTEQQPVMNNRRQSTRNRPLTTKALEALEMGFLTLPKKRKGVDFSENYSISRPSPRARRRTTPKATSMDIAPNDAAESITVSSNGFHDNNNGIVGEF